MKYISLLVLFVLSVSNLFSQTYEKIILNENFESATFPPSNWSLISNNTKTWKSSVLNDYPFAAINSQSPTSAVCEWDWKNTQNEGLISPWLSIGAYKDLSLVFYAGFNKSMSSNADLKLLARTSESATWDIIWNASKESVSNSSVWKWKKIEADLSQYVGNSQLQFAFQYQGKSGDLVGIDDVKLMEGYQYTKTGIYSFELSSQSSTPTIDNEQHTINVSLQYGTDLSSILPNIVHDGTISPEGNLNLQSQMNVEYTVTALNPTYTQKWNAIFKINDSEADIKKFEVAQQIAAATINTSSALVSITVAYGTDLSKLNPTIVLSNGAKILSQSSSFSDGKAVTFVIQAPNGTSAKTWKVTVNIQKVKNQAYITSFALPNQTSSTQIDTTSKEIHVELACTTDLTQAIPTLSLSDEASLVNTDTPVFKVGTPYIYTVKASNPTLAAVEWKVYVSLQDYLTDIYTFSLPVETEDIAINKDSHEIRIAVSKSTNITNITPIIVAAPCANVSPEGVQSFEVGQEYFYTVTPANSSVSPVIWKVIFTNAILKERFDSSTLPDSWTITSLNTEKTWTFKPLLSLPFSAINPKSTYSAVCPWANANSPQNELLTSPSRSTEGYSNLTLSFYTAFNKDLLNLANLKLNVLSGDTKTQVWAATDVNATQSGLTWYPISLNLTRFIPQTIRLQWQYEGAFGDVVAIDDVLLYENSVMTSISNVSSVSIKVYPNPTNAYIWVDVPFEATLEMYDITQKMVFTQKAHQGTLKIDVKNFKAGCYILKVIGKEKAGVQKIIVY